MYTTCACIYTTCILQADCLRSLPAVDVVEHDTFHHNVPMFLEREGLLIPLLKRECLALLLPQSPAALESEDELCT